MLSAPSHLEDRLSSILFLRPFMYKDLSQTEAVSVSRSSVAFAFSSSGLAYIDVEILDKTYT